MQGDATLAKDGTLSIGAEKVTAGKIATAAVTEAKIVDKAVTSRKHKPSIFKGSASASLVTAAGEMKDIPGMSITFTPAVVSRLWLTVMFHKTGAGGCTAQYLLDGAAKTPNFGIHPAEGGYCAIWLIEDLSAAEHTIKMRAQNNGVAATIFGSVENPNVTRMMGELVAE